MICEKGNFPAAGLLIFAALQNKSHGLNYY
jgi:hypothetical protein